VVFVPGKYRPKVDSTTAWDARAPTNHKWKAFRLQIPLSIATTIAVLGALTFFPRSEVICRDYNKMTWK
jgi:hypothetical protein